MIVSWDRLRTSSCLHWTLKSSTHKKTCTTAKTQTRQHTSKKEKRNPVSSKKRNPVSSKKGSLFVEKERHREKASFGHN
jgi:hypothetical protein